VFNDDVVLLETSDRRALSTCVDAHVNMLNKMRTAEWLQSTKSPFSSNEMQEKRVQMKRNDQSVRVKSAKM
jgi:hypothetical protein